MMMPAAFSNGLELLQHCLLKEVGPDTISVMKALKESLDPRYVRCQAVVT